MWTHIRTHTHAQQVIQISRANSEPETEPEPEPKPELQTTGLCKYFASDRNKDILLSKAIYVCVYMRVCVFAQIEFDLLKFDIFRDTSTANQANMSRDKTRV